MVSRRRVVAAMLVCAAFGLGGCAFPHAHHTVIRPDVPTGDPDPGGTRLAFLANAARRGVPSTAARAAGAREASTRSHWDHGGCDGGPPGWSNMKVTHSFRPTDQARVTSQVDGAMRLMGWTVDDHSSPSPAPTGGPPAVQRGPEAPHDYEYDHRGMTAHAWLLTPDQGGNGSWALDLEAPPADLPAAIC